MTAPQIPRTAEQFFQHMEEVGVDQYEMLQTLLDSYHELQRMGACRDPYAEIYKLEKELADLKAALARGVRCYYGTNVWGDPLIKLNSEHSNSLILIDKPEAGE